LAEKIFLPLLLTRPFRCEDCVARFFSFIWRSASNFSSTTADLKSLVYHSSTAALHSEVYHSRRGRRYSSIKKTLPIQPVVSPAESQTSPLLLPALRPKTLAAAAGAGPRNSVAPPVDPLADTLGILLEIKPQAR
jgi:hypothetical protein